METETGPKPQLSNIQKIRMIEETIEREIRPSLKHDGGDIELIDVVGNPRDRGHKGRLCFLPGFQHDPEELC